MYNNKDENANRFALSGNFQRERNREIKIKLKSIHTAS